MTWSKVVVVTGGSRGIRRAEVERLAGEGVAVAVGYPAMSDASREIVTGIGSGDGSAVAVHADVAGAAQVAALCGRASRSSVVSTSWTCRPAS